MKTTALALALVAAAPAAHPGELLMAPTGRAVPGSYIVTLKEGQAVKPGGRQPGLTVSQLADDIAARYGGRLTHTYAVIDGFALRLGDEQAGRLARDPRVARVEQDQIVRVDAVQDAPPAWGIDRIDQRTRPLGNSYAYDFTGRGVHAYVIDTGIRATHQEFTGRIGNGFTVVDDGHGEGDCFNHGTHVAAILGGTRFGVAKQVILHSVRVIGCTGDGAVAEVIAGVDWVTQNHIKPAVANMSLGDPVTPSLDAAVENSIQAGVTYAVSAGNNNFDACNKSPARVPAALTAGASTIADGRAHFSNFGRCVDLFAPGLRILSASNDGDDAVIRFDGTSMAAPHVAGVAALYLEQFGDQPPALVHQALVDNATPGVMGGLAPGTANRILHSRFGRGPTTVLFSDDFEAERGWTRNLNGTDTATGGRWMRGDPEATGAGASASQLGTTTSGVNDLVTGALAGSSQEANDLDGGVSSIASPPIALPATGSISLSFFYYFVRVGDSSETDFFRVRIAGSRGSATVFELARFEANEIAVWSSGYADLSGFAGQTVRVWIEAVDAGSSSLVEAAVDDVIVTHAP